ncbi:DUF4910 domain-containing protein [Nostoc sp. ChiQUE01b]|uniref:DUF4910 domain-containing protein n=1 Tax=Nostoc sp. ChiQUE01b TaxID=3075376 RepID=UPI002AD32A02|nr:DUF4910 domain-containing protein [Nostoc sp. ChiQUE01b]MDZ8260536.1 DUF4910 domain-containing protein [Nostoc sp. ChiQUE01b]
MNISSIKTSSEEIAQEVYQLVYQLYPICRSITGNGVRETLKLIQQHIPLSVHEVPTGTQIFDWTVPKEWNIKDAYIKNSQGKKIVDFANSNLHVVSYSLPIDKKVFLTELKAHLFTLPEYPDWIPFRTSYYKEAWGFCLSHNQYLELNDQEYEVFIDSSLEPGHLTYGEYYIPGKSTDEVLISCHVCHPSLCNDNLSGIAIATFIAKYLSQTTPRYSYRFLWIPGTIGSITWLALNEAKVNNIKHGLVLTCLGDSGNFTYKKSRRGDTEIDKVAAYVLKNSKQDYKIIDFFPYGYDERQYCSPGFNLAVGCLMRSSHNCFPEYHTSADDLNFVQPQYLAESFFQCSSILHILNNNDIYYSKNPKCEPQLGRRGLYQAYNGRPDSRLNQMATLWVLNLSDGQQTLLDIAERSGMSFDMIKYAADTLLAHDLLTIKNS